MSELIQCMFCIECGCMLKCKLRMFHAEICLRVMSICHTVVVEKEIDACTNDSKSDESVASTPGIGSILKRWNRSRNNRSGR